VTLMPPPPSPSPPPFLYWGFRNFTFTTCGVSGASGPTLANCQSSYSGAAWLSQLFSMTIQGIQRWTVPISGNYALIVAGAMGGSSPNAPGGGGRIISASIALNAGTVLQILVGQVGGTFSMSNGYSAGGGGGTFVVYNSTAPVVIAGGGGGGSNGQASNSAYLFPGASASALGVTSGTAAPAGYGSGGAGGSAGGGGAAQGGSGGGGLSGSGSQGLYGGGPGSSFTSGGQGGTNNIYAGSAITNILGGYGGGAGAGLHTTYETDSGGGGGYSGGGGSSRTTGGGGGGGNYVSSSAFNVSDGGLNNGPGYVFISFLSSLP